MKDGNSSKECAFFSLCMALAERKDVAEVCMKVREKENTRYTSTQEDKRPTEQVGRQNAEEGDGHEDAECVAVDA